MRRRNARARPVLRLGLTLKQFDLGIAGIHKLWWDALAVGQFYHGVEELHFHAIQGDRLCELDLVQSTSTEA